MSSAWRAARGIQRSRRRGRDENQCDFKPIQASLSLNNCNLQLLYLPPPLPRTSEMPYCGGTQLPSQLYFTKNNPSIIPLGRPKSYKDSSETFCQYHLLDDELRKFLMCCKKCFLSPETMRQGPRGGPQDLAMAHILPLDWVFDFTLPSASLFPELESVF